MQMVETDERQEALFDDLVECEECGNEYATIAGVEVNDGKETVIMRCTHCGHQWARL